MGERGSAAEPGWYAAPGMPGARRYWDGSAWTDHVAPEPTSPPSATTTASNLLVVLLAIGIAIAAVFVVAAIVSG